MMPYDREEGEIDSDEGELLKRIEELENENREYEKIAKISGARYNSSSHRFYERKNVAIVAMGHNGGYQNFDVWDARRAGRVPTDVSSISSLELTSPKKRKRKRSKVRKTRNHSKHSHSRCRTLTHTDYQERHSHGKEASRRKHRSRHNVSSDLCVETISLDSSASETSERNQDLHSVFSTDEEGNDIALPLSREELRLALARSTKRDCVTVGTLKERLQREKHLRSVGDEKEGSQYHEGSQKNQGDACIEDHNKLIEEDDSEDSVSLEEQELRLIALRSAIMKKHQTRKKRNAEVAYSPTDFEELLIDSASLVDTDLEELPGEMEISPAVSPKLLLSPVPCDDQSTSSSKSIIHHVDTKSVDMDIVNSDSEDEPHIYINSCLSLWPQADNVPLPDCAVDTKAGYSFLSAPMAGDTYCLYMPEMDMASNSILPVVATPQNVCSPIESEKQPMAAPANHVDESSNEPAPKENERKCKIELGSSDEEEEEALRALLLSKIPKISKNSRGDALLNAKHNRKTLNETETDTLRSLLLGNKVDQTVLKKPSELILKEAVRRLKIQTCTESSSMESKPPIHTTNEANNESNSAKENILDEHPNLGSFEEGTLTKAKNKGLKQSVISHENIQDPNVNSNCGEYCTTNAATATKEACVQLPATNETADVKSREESEVLKPLENENATNTRGVSYERNTQNQKSAEVSIDKSVPVPPLALLKTKPSIGFKRKLPSSTESNSLINTILKETSPRLQTGPQQQNVSTIKSTPASSSQTTKTNTKTILKPVVKTLKIVKPHKVINTSSVVKTAPMEKNSKKSEVNLTNGSAGAFTSRILTSANGADLKTEKLIISLAPSSDAESDDEEELYQKSVEQSVLALYARSDTPDSIVGALNENCYDNLPATLNKESSMRVGIGSANTAPCEDAAQVNESFEKKLDSFLRDVRSKVQKNVIPGCDSFTLRKDKEKVIRDNSTPMAVRHLPPASQEEYKRLIHRMQLLEQQKQLKRSQGKEAIKEPLNTPSNTQSASNVRSNASKESGALRPTKSSSSNGAITKQKSLIKKVLARNTVKHNSMTSGDAKENVLSDGSENLKLNQLKSFETSFNGVSKSIVTNLNKCLQLVEEAKKAKIAKMRYSLRLRELRLELEETQHKLKDAQNTVTCCSSLIFSSNATITSLSEKRMKILAAATQLGQSIKGEAYRLDNELKKEIALKKKTLVAEIKFVNSIQYCDLDSLDGKKQTGCTLSALPSSTNSSAWDITVNTPSSESHCLLEQNTADTKTSMQDICAVSVGKHEAIPRASFKPTEAENNDAPPKEAAAMDLPSESKEDVKGQEEDQKCDGKDEENKVLRKYVSPLDHMNSTSQWDPSGIICPYELMGRCEDKDCNYVHFVGREKVNTHVDAIKKQL